MRMNGEQRAAMESWLAMIGRYGGQDGARIEATIAEDGTLTVSEKGLERQGEEYVVRGSAEVTIDTSGTIRTIGGVEVPV